MRKGLIVLGLVGLLATVGFAEPMQGFDEIDSTLEKATDTAKNLFKFVVMVVSWGLVLAAVFFVNKFREKQADRLDNKQGEEGSYLMLYVKTGLTGIIALMMVGFLIFIIWGKAVPIQDSFTEEATYGKVIRAALIGDVDTESETTPAE
jgi:Na+/proline symporter